MAKDTTPLEEFRRVTATTMRAISKKDVNVSFVPDGGSLLGQEARITVPARDLPVEGGARDLGQVRVAERSRTEERRHGRRVRLPRRPVGIGARG